MLDEKTIEELLIPIEIYTPATSTPLCPICSTPLEEDWAQEIDNDNEIYDVEVYSCLECGFQELI